MAKVSPVHSDDESASDSGNRASKKTKNVDEEPMEVDGEEGGEEGSGEESEYEIEAIMDAKRGSFPEGRMGYLVKWKGYGDSENSWVDEKDAGNAQSLIDEYWKKHGKKAAARKSMDAKTPKKPRKSAASEEIADTSTTKKRGRKSLTAAESPRDDSEATEVRVTKKLKKNGTAKDESEEPSHPTEDDPVLITDMSKYMAIQSWEHLVKTIDTIEREPDNTLAVYFALENGERVKEDSRLCAKRFPQKLILFYESNLRWKSASEHGADES